MNIAILHNAVSSDDSLEDLDTLTQVQAVFDSLDRLGHQAVAIPCTLDLAALRATLLEPRPELVFYLVESLGGTDSMLYLPSALLDDLSIPHTGNPTEALFSTSNKLMAKRVMQLAGLPTPRWYSGNGGPDFSDSPLLPPCIIKSVWEHGSRGLDDGNVILDGGSEQVRQQLLEFTVRTGRPHFAEEFIQGREFNVPMLEGENGAQVLPVGEMDFSTFPADKPRIIGHRAKWHVDSMEYENTPRSFQIAERDQLLVEHLRRLSLECWRLFGMRGYARIDFRVDQSGRPWILEINSNPCLSPDAGYVAALEEAGLGYDEAIRRIVERWVTP